LTHVGYFGLAREEDEDATRRKLAVDLADLGRGGTEGGREGRRDGWVS